MTAAKALGVLQRCARRRRIGDGAQPRARPVGADILDVIKERSADQLVLRQADDQFAGRQAAAADLTGRARRSTPSSPSISPASPSRRASSPLAASPAYGVGDGSSARTTSRPGRLAWKGPMSRSCTTSIKARSVARMRPVGVRSPTRRGCRVGTAPDAACFRSTRAATATPPARCWATSRPGVIVSDRYAVYLYIDDTQRQLCLAHLLKDFIALGQRRGAAGRLSRQLTDCLTDTFAVSKK
jgi:hypothetical protein